MPRVDVPEFRRCCFCLPLRYGLLVWGYLKMILLLLLVSLIFSEILRQPIVNEWILSITIHWIVIYVIVFLCIDIVFIMIFSVAGHLKHPLLYRVYYYYCIGLWVAYLLLLISSIAWNSCSRLRDAASEDRGPETD